MVLQFLFTMGLAWFLACAGVAIRDLRHLLGVALTLWMFLTPIVYPAEMVPPRFRWVLALNPLSYVVQAYRDVVLERRLPAALDVVVLSVVALTVFAAGHAVFRYTKHLLADLL
jgi:ABC-type polysaccharide/polyol phosphate export permease